MWSQEAGKGGTGRGSGLGNTIIVTVQTLFPAPKLGLIEARDLVMPSCAQLPLESSPALKGNLLL